MTKNLSPQERQIDFSIEQLCKLRNRRRGTLLIPSAMASIEHEFFLDVRARERFVRPAAEMRLSLLYDGAVVEYRANVAGEIVRIRIIRIDHVTDFRREREHILVAHRGVRESVEADDTAYKACGEQKRRRKFCGVTVRRALFVGQRLPNAVHRAFRHFADQLLHIAGLDAACSKALRTVDVGMRHRPAGIWLECKRLGYPARTEITSEGALVALRRMGEAVEESMAALEHGARPDESAPREQRCADAGLCRPSGMQSFRPGALRQVLDDARRHAGGNAERIDKLFCVQAQRSTHTSCRSHRAEDGRRMAPGLVNRLRNDRAQPAPAF